MIKPCVKCGATDRYVYGACRPCAIARTARWVANNPNRKKEADAKYRANNPEKIKEYNRKYHSDNPEIAKINGAKWRKNNKEKRKVSCAKWLAANPEKRKISTLKWRSENPDKVKANKLRQRSTLMGALNMNMAVSIRQSLSVGAKNGRHWESLVDFTASKLKTHLEKLFLPGMAWENRGEWQIDHKIPLSAFNFTTAEDLDFKRCWSLKNLQPMWAKENMSKNNKLDKPFQPSLHLQEVKV